MKKARPFSSLVILMRVNREAGIKEVGFEGRKEGVRGMGQGGLEDRREVGVEWKE